MGKHRETETEEGAGNTQRGPADQKGLPPEEIGDSQHTGLPPPPPPPTSYRPPSNASSLVGCSPMDRDNKERRINNTQAASAAVGGALYV